MNDLVLFQMHQQARRDRWRRWILWSCIQATGGLWIVRAFIEWDLLWPFSLGAELSPIRALLLVIWTFSAFVGVIVRAEIWKAQHDRQG